MFPLGFPSCSPSLRQSTAGLRNFWDGTKLDSMSCGSVELAKSFPSWDTLWQRIWANNNISHQPRFPLKIGNFPSLATLRYGEVAIIWPQLYHIILKTCLFGYFPILKLLLFWSFLVFSTWFEADLAGSHSSQYLEPKAVWLSKIKLWSPKNTCTTRVLTTYNHHEYLNTKRNDHFKYLYIILHQPTNQTQVFLVRYPMIISDQNGKTAYHPQQKETWKSPPKNQYSRWLGFCIFDDHLEAFFSPTNITWATEKRFPISKNISLLDTETHLTDSKKRCLDFYSCSVVFLVAPQKESTSNWCFFFSEIPAVSRKTTTLKLQS